MKSLSISLSALFILLCGLACSPQPSVKPTPSVPPDSISLTPQIPDLTTPTVTTASLYVCVAVANVRTGPGMTFPVLKQLTQGTVIAPLKKDGEWYYLGQDSALKDSYIHESVVCTQGATAASAPASPGASNCPSGCTQSAAGCLIKGNIVSKSGEKIYFMPGDSGYEETIIDPDYGERWFCTEAEAQANGWRRSGR